MQKPKTKPKRKGGIPLDKLLAAHGSGRPIGTAPKRRTPPKPAQKGPKNAPGRVLRPEAEQEAVEPASPRLVGYARVSTDEQTTALQADALERAAVALCYTENASGSAKSRPVLDQTLADLRAGDTLVVWRLDRLGRSLGHLIEIASTLRDRGIFLRSLSEGFDTSTASGRLLYHVLGAVAEFEREVLKERTIAGMKAAKKRGQHVGRPHALAGARLETARKMLKSGKSQTEVARILRVSRATIQRTGGG
jgi:DNA invertase Pin-like site-specific DNA recombinase